MRTNDPKPGDTDNVLLQKIALKLTSVGGIADPAVLTTLQQILSEEITSNATLTQLLTPQDFWFKASLGQIPGLTFHRLTGLNPDVDTGSTPEDVWEFGGLFPFQAAAQNLEILSSNAADAAAGTGLRTAFVEGLNSAFVPQSESVTLNGLTPVPLVNQYLRINQFTGTSAGSGVANAGDITLRVAGAGAVQGYLQAGSGHGHRAIYTVPAGHTARVLDLFFSLVRGSADDVAEFQVNIRGATGSGIWVQRFLTGVPSQGGAVGYTSRFAFSVEEKSDIRMTCNFVSASESRVLATGVLAITDNAIFPP